MGAGGAAQAVVGALLGAKVGRLIISNRTFAKAEALADRFKVSAARYDDVRDAFEIVINATSAGLGADPAVFPTAAVGKTTLAYDMVYGRDTAFLKAASAKGARCADGLGMLVEQAAESFFIWRGVRPPTRSVLASLRGR
jgi:shikimate dehydrogenase